MNLSEVIDRFALGEPDPMGLPLAEREAQARDLIAQGQAQDSRVLESYLDDADSRRLPELDEWTLTIHTFAKAFAQSGATIAECAEGFKPLGRALVQANRAIDSYFVFEPTMFPPMPGFRGAPRTTRDEKEFQEIRRGHAWSSADEVRLRDAEFEEKVARWRNDLILRCRRHESAILWPEAVLV